MYIDIEWWFLYGGLIFSSLSFFLLLVLIVLILVLSGIFALHLYMHWREEGGQ